MDYIVDAFINIQSNGNQYENISIALKQKEQKRWFASALTVDGWCSMVVDYFIIVIDLVEVKPSVFML